MSTVIITDKRNPGCLVQLIWFVFIGWWVGLIWVSLAWLLMLPVITIPVAVEMINRVPRVIALRQQDAGMKITVVGSGQTTVGQTPQRNMVLRIIYFLLIGIWFSGIWMAVAYLLCATIIGMPAGFWMFDRTPAVLTLHRG